TPCHPPFWAVTSLTWKCQGLVSSGFAWAAFMRTVSQESQRLDKAGGGLNHHSHGRVGAGTVGVLSAVAVQKSPPRAPFDLYRQPCVISVRMSSKSEGIRFVPFPHKCAGFGTVCLRLRSDWLRIGVIPSPTPNPAPSSRERAPRWRRGGG